MAPNRGQLLAAQYGTSADTIANDFDPEDERIQRSESDDVSQFESDEDADRSREHYVNVARSALRKEPDLALGPQYAGSRIARDAVVDNEDDDDPFSKDFGDEDSEVDPTSDDGSVLEGAEDGETSDTDITDGDADNNVFMVPATNEPDRTELRRIMAEEQKVVAASISQATKADAEKGRAVKRQRATFDSLLNTRIKLQKALVATNTLVGSTHGQGATDDDSRLSETIASAETAAFKLWSSLDDFRERLVNAKTGTKRKRSTFPASTSTSDLWKHMQVQEAQSLPQRNSILEKWSFKARGASALPTRNRLNNTAQATIVDVLQEQLSGSDRLVKRTRTPRSCAPFQLANKVSEDEHIYDDADFYGLLLKELLEQKSADSVAASNIDFKYQTRREAKTKKNVDTKASKGRKLRYTLHEKLQNFMAPEDRGTWGERQTDELFGSLFGRKMGLSEEEADKIVGEDI